jgi:hypothetical protein
MNVKLQGLLNAVEFVEKRYGQQALAEVLAECGEPVRQRCAVGIAIEWHPMDELVEFLRVADAHLGRGDGGLAVEAGAAAAEKNLRGMFQRAVLWLANAEFLLRRIATLFRQFNEQGEMTVASLQDGVVELEVKGVPNPHFLFCCVLTGWMRQVSISAGRPRARIDHYACRGRGDGRCRWRAEFEPLTSTPT